MANESNAKQIKALMAELHDLIAEEEGWEPKTSRDYAILTWAAVQDLRGDVGRLKGLYDRVKALESNQGILAAINAVLSVIAGYLGVKY